METYFADCSTVAETKTLYKQLALENHPDRGGDTRTMQDINVQYHQKLEALNGEVHENGSYRYNSETEQEIMDKLQNLLKINDLEIDLIGFWIWVGGDTKPVKESLKEEGCRWHSQRMVWYYKPQGWKRTRRNSGASLDELAEKYGSQSFRTASKEYAVA